MSWPMPPSGQWNPSMAHNMPPQINDVNLSSYTPDQWAMMQQQNWHQWAQWQQQYAQWQSQYGDKYAEQLQAMQAMPPLPVSNVPPPAPPPPDQPPPPPPPHENNQPLYGVTASQPAPVAPPQNQNNTNFGNANMKTGNIQNWPHSQESLSDNKPTSSLINKAPPAVVNKPSLAIVNAEALKKLAEEEKLFDIQFKKWEEEIEKWRTENINHPDKQAYRDYEQKFEACRAQLMERRQQMNQKRASLLGNTPQTINSASTLNNVSVSIPPLMQNTNNYHNHQQQNYDNMNKPVQNYQVSELKQPFNNQEYKKPQLNYNRKEDQDSHYNQQLHNQDYQKSQPNYNRNINKNIDPQDRYESYQDMDEDYSVANTNFLPTSSSKKNIPGLDLVPEDKTVSKREEVINLSDDTPEFPQQPQHSGPDYSKISKGINNILGDEKIMNILSMVRGGNTFNNQNNFSNTTNAEFSGGPNTNMENKQWERYQNNDQYENRQNMSYRRPDQNSELQQEHRANYPPMLQQKRAFYDQKPNDYDSSRQLDRINNRQDQYFNNESSEHDHGPLPNRQGLSIMRSNYLSSRPPPLQQGSDHLNINYARGSNIKQHNDNIPTLSQPPRPKWVDDPLFTPSIIVEYEHKPLRLKAREFIEPVHTFDYNHKSKDEEYKKKDFEKEVDELFSRKHRNFEEDEIPATNRYSSRDLYYRDSERRAPREEFERRIPRDDLYVRGASRDDYLDRQRADDRYYDERRRDDRDRFSRREDSLKDRERARERERSRNQYADRNRDFRRDEKSRHSRSIERDSRKRAHSKDSDVSDSSSIKKSKGYEFNSALFNQCNEKTHIVTIDDILESPGREIRPDKIVIILRGPPGSGKSYLAKLIRDREAEHGGTVRIMSIDDYFMQEGEIEEKDLITGKIVKKPTLKYEYDEKSEEIYSNSLRRAFKRTITDGYFTFLIYDAVNEQLKCYAELWNFSRQQGFQVYICTMELDPQICYKRNIHNRSLTDIEVVCARFFPTPAHHIQLDATTLLQNASITDVHMEDAVDEPALEDPKDTEVENIFISKWEKMDDAVQLARLDGTSKPLRPSQPSMEDYLQLEDWKPTTAKPGKKTVRWADIEERRQQEKMRAIGFVVGQTDWDRMTDPTMGSGALTKTKYIERVKRN